MRVAINGQLAISVVQEGWRASDAESDSHEAIRSAQASTNGTGAVPVQSSGPVPLQSSKLTMGAFECILMDVTMVSARTPSGWRCAA
jgi:hypothetical protein